MIAVETPAEVLARLVELTDDLVTRAEHVEELAQERRMDARQARAGRVRVGCSWCGGEFYTEPAGSVDELDLNGGYSCRACQYKNGY